MSLSGFSVNDILGYINLFPSYLLDTDFSKNKSYITRVFDKHIIIHSTDVMPCALHEKIDDNKYAHLIFEDPASQEKFLVSHASLRKSSAVLGVLSKHHLPRHRSIPLLDSLKMVTLSVNQGPRVGVCS